MTLRQLQESFHAWRSEAVPLVLASVYETRGSTYSKAGARMLVTGDGRFQGMLSGGCLEGDLAERARAVIESGTPQSVTYDLGGHDEELWGLGVGCDGLMRIFLQPLLPASDYQPFTSMTAVLASDDPGAAITVLESADASLEAGATLLVHGGNARSFGVPEIHRARLGALAAEVLAEARSHTVRLDLAGRAVDVLAARLVPPPRLLLLGAGLDAAPVLRLARELGWRVTVQDHRPANFAGGRFAAADRVLCEPAARLSEQVDLERFDAVIVMSHHLATDRVYLRQLADSRIPYIGLLGPRDRRRRLVEDIAGDSRAAADSLAARLHGPAGLDIGADGPASIALSILAEIHGALKA